MERLRSSPVVHTSSERGLIANSERGLRKTIDTPSDVAYAWHLRLCQRYSNMKSRLDYPAVAAATNLSRTQIDQWISRKYFRPKNEAKIGTARVFTVHDAVVLGALAEFARMGLPLAPNLVHVHDIYKFDDEDALLVITQGTITTKGKSAVMYDPHKPFIHNHVIRSKDLSKIATDHDVRAMSVVNLSHIAQRVFKSIAKA